MSSAIHYPDWRPESATTPADLVSRMRSLKDWSGLSYRELSRRAACHGDFLPRSTLAEALGRSDLPREDLVAALGRACGLPPAEVDRWVLARRTLAAGWISPQPARPVLVTSGVLSVIITILVVARAFFRFR